MSLNIYTVALSWFFSARRGRVYLPQDELAQAGLSDEDIFNGVVTNRWRNFMNNLAVNSSRTLVVVCLAYTYI